MSPQWSNLVPTENKTDHNIQCITGEIKIKTTITLKSVKEIIDEKHPGPSKNLELGFPFWYVSN